jgi:hypothetical protein
LDRCEVVSGYAPDCNLNEVPDDCEAFEDCNGNGIMDICDGPSGYSDDVNENGIPDECECTSLTVLPPLTAGVANNRFLSLSPDNPGMQTALRITVTDAPEESGELVGARFWVGQPRAISESSGDDGDAAPAFTGAGVGCAPYYADWGAFDTIHVYGEPIAPGVVYEVEAIAEGCALLFEDNYSAPLPTPTSAQWGDVTGGWTGSEWSAPEGAADFVDISALVDKFKNVPTAPSKVRTDLAGQLLDLRVDFVDIAYAVDAFGGSDYPFAAGLPCP